MMGRGESRKQKFQVSMRELIETGDFTGRKAGLLLWAARSRRPYRSNVRPHPTSKNPVHAVHFVPNHRATEAAAAAIDIRTGVPVT